MIQKTKLKELKTSTVKSDQISDISNKEIHPRRQGNNCGDADTPIINVKKGYLKKGKIQGTKKVKEDLELIMSLFQQE